MKVFKPVHLLGAWMNVDRLMLNTGRKILFYANPIPYSDPVVNAQTLFIIDGQAQIHSKLSSSVMTSLVCTYVKCPEISNILFHIFITTAVASRSKLGITFRRWH